MKCPFLKETRVKFCQVSPIRKMIVSEQGDTEVEKCSTVTWISCPLAQQRFKDISQRKQTQCPFLKESFVQYCSISSVTKFIPYNEAPFSRCTNDNHRYCEDYLTLAHPTEYPPGTDPELSSHGKDTSEHYVVHSILMPKRLYYTPNHLWVDRSDNGTVHIGIDGLLAKVLSPIQQLCFVTTKGISRPTVVVTVNNVDLEIIFPFELLITGFNSYLRAGPEKVCTDPYGTGWLFEAKQPRNVVHDMPLLFGDKARYWMELESERLNEFVHNELNGSRLEGTVLMADGGVYIDGLAHHLHRDQLLKLFHTFFSPFVTRR